METDYEDALWGSAESWLAAFAPVGQTGHVVAVQMRRNAVSGTTRTLARTLLLSSILTVVFAGIVVFQFERARRS